MSRSIVASTITILLLFAMGLWIGGSWGELKVDRPVHVGPTIDSKILKGHIIYRRTHIEDAFDHFHSLVRDEAASTSDSVRLGEFATSLHDQKLSPQDQAVLRLAGEIGSVSRGCYQRISDAKIVFRAGWYRQCAVASAWNHDRIVAWIAYDTVDHFEKGFHLDREACLEMADSVSARPSFFHRLFHF